MTAKTAASGTDLGRRIREQRDRVGLSRAELAERAGLSVEYLANLESSPGPNPTQATLIRVAAALGTSVPDRRRSCDRRRHPRGPVSFDVDHLDEALGDGWSVLVTGTASVISDPAELDRAAALGVQPWAAGERPVYVRLPVRQVTGRAIRVRD